MIDVSTTLQGAALGSVLVLAGYAVGAATVFILLYLNNK